MYIDTFDLNVDEDEEQSELPHIPSLLQLQIMR